MASYLEVLAALTMDIDQFSWLMQSETAMQRPEFYDKYLNEVKEIIIKDADNEFNCLWREKGIQNKTLSEVSDLIALKVSEYKDAIVNNLLWEKHSFRRKIIFDGIFH